MKLAYQWPITTTFTIIISVDTEQSSSDEKSLEAYIMLRMFAFIDMKTYTNYLYLIR